MGLLGLGRLIVRFGPSPFLAPFFDQARMCRPLSNESHWRGIEDPMS